MASPADNRHGILAMLASVATFVTGDMLMRLAGETLPTGQTIVLRGVMATILIIGFAAATGLFRTLPQFLTPLVLLRGFLEGLISVLFIAALPLLPFAVITATTLASSLIATAIAALLRIEQVGVRRWAALAVGFVGVLTVLRPSPSDLHPAVLLVVGATVLIGARDVVTRHIKADTPTIVVALASMLLVTGAGSMLGVFETPWRWPTRHEGAILAIAACTVAFGNAMVITAFRKSDVAVIAPFRYTSIVIATVIGFVVWGETPDRWTVIGALMIVGSGLYTIWRERVRARQALARAP